MNLSKGTVSTLRSPVCLISCILCFVVAAAIANNLLSSEKTRSADEAAVVLAEDGLAPYSKTYIAYFDDFPARQSLPERRLVTPAPDEAHVMAPTQEDDSADVALNMFSVEEPVVLDMKEVVAAVKQVATHIPLISFDKIDKERAIVPAWQEHAALPVQPEVTDKPRVVIIIDDVGLNRAATKKLADLPGPLDLAFLPYAPHVKEQAKMGRNAGHEIMIHMPMEPMNGKLDTGPVALKVDMDDKTFDENLLKAFQSMDGYVGLNNHMGSRLTQDKQAMTRLMKRLKDKGLLFVDSRTIHSSVAAETAAVHDVPYAVRDVFIDHVATDEGVRKSLALIEKVALKKGLAIAIGHPKAVTINALAEWLPTLKDKGIMITPVSQIVHASVPPEMTHAQSHFQRPQ